MKSLNNIPKYNNLEEESMEDFLLFLKKNGIIKDYYYQYNMNMSAFNFGIITWRSDGPFWENINHK